MQHSCIRDLAISNKWVLTVEELLALIIRGRLKGELQPETLWHARHALRRAGIGFFELLALARDPGRLKGELQPETLWHARHALRRAGIGFFELLALARDPGKAQRRITARNPLACAACLKAGWNRVFRVTRFSS